MVAITSWLVSPVILYSIVAVGTSLSYMMENCVAAVFPRPTRSAHWLVVISIVISHVTVGSISSVNCDQLIVWKLIQVQFVIVIPVSVNPVTSSEKSTVMVNQVFVYQILLLVIVDAGCVWSIRVTFALTIQVETSQESSKSKIPLVRKVYVYGSGMPAGLFVTTTHDSSKAHMVAVTLPLVGVDGL